MDNLSAEEIAKAEALVAKMREKAEAALDPLAREMRLMKWDAEYQKIMWELVAAMALKRSLGDGG